MEINRSNQSSMVNSNWETMTRLRAEEWRLSTHYKLEKKVSSMHAAVSEKIDVEHLWFATKQLLITIANQNTKETVHFTETIDHTKVNTALQIVGQTVEKVSCEIANKCSGVSTGLTGTTTLSLLEELSQYSWHAKVAIFATAFAINYGEFRETYKLYEKKNEVVQSIARLKLFSGILEYSEITQMFGTISVFVVKLVELIHCVIGFGSLSVQDDLCAYMMDIKSAAYWAIDSIVYCNSLIATRTAAINNGNMQLIFNQRHFAEQINKIVSIYEFLNQQYESYRACFEGERYMEKYQEYHLVFTRVDHIENTESLKVIIGASNNTDKCLISQGQTQAISSIQHLHNKKTMFLFSSLSIKEHYSEDFEMIEKYSTSIKKGGYEIVWLPIFGDLNCVKSEEYTQWIQEKRWYSYTVKYEHLATIQQELKIYLQKEWGFDGRPMLTMFDVRGNLICKNAIHKLWMVSNQSSQADSCIFDQKDMSPCGWSERWWMNWCSQNQTWGLSFLCQQLNVQQISQWFMSQKDVVFLYGGRDIKWFESHKLKLEVLFESTGIQHQIAYGGSSKDKFEGVTNLSLCEDKGISTTYNSTKVLDNFWYRVQSAVTSFNMYKHKLHGVSETMVSSMTSLLSLEGSGENWVAFGCGGIKEMVVCQETELKETLEIIVKEQCLKTWRTYISHGMFVQQLCESHSLWIKECRTTRTTLGHCYKLHLTAEVGQVVGDIKCAACACYMKKMMVYECCKEATVLSSEIRETYERILMSKKEEITQNNMFNKEQTTSNYMSKEETTQNGIRGLSNMNNTKSESEMEEESGNGESNRN
ncbi:hypothetical protein LUZ60_009098 [Juncus effusus]|nr:hypothetical protein LUZ60_009098 [Juncus effusus]